MLFFLTRFSREDDYPMHAVFPARRACGWRRMLLVDNLDAVRRVSGPDCETFVMTSVVSFFVRMTHFWHDWGSPVLV